MAKKKKKSGMTMGGRVLLVCGLLMAIVFLPSTFLLMIGMMPTPFAFLVDRSEKKSKVIAVGAINLVGCAPFLFDLWTNGNNFDASFAIVSNPKAIIVMYSAAAVGYMVSWAMTGIVSSILFQRGQARAKAIEKRQAELVERWGREVTGEIPLDEFGFPLDAGVQPAHKGNPRKTPD